MASIRIRSSIPNVSPLEIPLVSDSAGLMLERAVTRRLVKGRGFFMRYLNDTTVPAQHISLWLPVGTDFSMVYDAAGFPAKLDVQGLNTINDEMDESDFLDVYSFQAKK